jgi:uncharacterized glyoxalase superfamily protein PhnB
MLTEDCWAVAREHPETMMRLNPQMPIQDTFWAARFGMLMDRFAVQWWIDCEKAS